MKPRDEAEAVGEHDRADHAVLAGQHAEHPVADAALLRGRRRRGAGNGAVSATAASEPAAQRAQRRGRGARRRGAIASRAVARAEAGAQRRAAVGGEQDDLGLLGAEGLERALEQALERDRDLGRLATACGWPRRGTSTFSWRWRSLDVRAVADEGDQDRDQQQRRRPRAARSRGCAQTSAIAVPVTVTDEVHAEHLAHLVARDAALGEHDRGEDQRDRQHAAELRRGEQRAPQVDPAEARVERRRPACTTMISTQRHERELREVEDELDRRQAGAAAAPRACRP